MSIAGAPGAKSRSKPASQIQETSVPSARLSLRQKTAVRPPVSVRRKSIARSQPAGFFTSTMVTRASPSAKRSMRPKPLSSRASEPTALSAATPRAVAAATAAAAL